MNCLQTPHIVTPASSTTHQGSKASSTESEQAPIRVRTEKNKTMCKGNELLTGPLTMKESLKGVYYIILDYIENNSTKYECEK